MVIVLKNNKYYADYPDSTLITPTNDEQVIIIPNKININLAYQSAGFDTKNGLIGLPNPLSIEGFFSSEELRDVRRANATFSRQQKEVLGVIWNGHRFETNTKTCQSIAIAINSIMAGMLAQPLNWRDADGNFISLSLEQLKEIAVMVMSVTEQQFNQEKIDSE